MSEEKPTKKNHTTTTTTHTTRRRLTQNEKPKTENSTRLKAFQLVFFRSVVFRVCLFNILQFVVEAAKFEHIIRLKQDNEIDLEEDLLFFRLSCGAFPYSYNIVICLSVYSMCVSVFLLIVP